MTAEKKYNLLQRFLRMGAQPTDSFIDTQKGYMFNLFILIGTPFAIISFIVNISSNALLPTLVNLVQICCFSLAIWISKTRRLLNLRIVLLLCLSIMSTIAAYVYQNSGEYRLLIMIVAAVVLFDKNWQYLLYAFIASAVFVYIRIISIPGIHEADLSTIIFSTAKISLPLLLFVLSLLYFKNVYFHNLFELEHTNMALSVAKEQKERILNTVAHDLRSPINNIAAITKMLQEKDPLTQHQRELLSLIEHATDASIILINDLLQNSDHSINNQVQQEIIDLNGFIKQCIPALQIRAKEKQISIQSDLYARPLKVSVDCDRMERVITNLVNNAIKFSGNGTTVTVQTEKTVHEALIMVKDQGIGIPLTKQAQVFEMFTDAKRIGTAGEKSFGMGLSICKQIVEQHQGAITVASTEGEGTVFTVRLPLLD